MARAPERILIAVAGSHDPNGENDPELTGPPDEIDGPILTSLMHRYPAYTRLIVLFIRSGSNSGASFKRRAENTLALAKKRLPTIETDLVELEEMNPVDHNAVLNGLYQWFLKRFGGVDPFPFIDVDISPGTPAVQTAWLLLSLANTLPINLIRSVRKADAGPDGPRCSEVIVQSESFARVILPSQPSMNFDTAIHAIRHPSSEIAELAKNAHFVTRDRKALKALDTIRKIAPSIRVVLVQGEPGTGKELAARLFQQVATPGAPFGIMNCAGLTAELARSELFGHKKGSFTGATQDKPGLIKQTQGGTLFLDEIGELDLQVQAQLLRFLQEGTIQPVGGSSEEKVDVRVVAATNRNLEQAVEEGLFRKDLLDRLGQSVVLPPLRQRQGDIRILAEHFLSSAMRDKAGKNLNGFHPQVLAKLENYDWPGNVRELRGVIDRIIAHAEPDEELVTLPLLNEAWQPRLKTDPRLKNIFTLLRPLPEPLDSDYLKKLLLHRVAVQLARQHPELVRDGKPNENALSKLMGLTNKPYGEHLRGTSLNEEDVESLD